MVLVVGVLNEALGFGTVSPWKQARSDARADTREFFVTLIYLFSAKAAD